MNRHHDLPEGRLFGTDGIRDVANRGALAPENLVRLGRSIGTCLRRWRQRGRIRHGSRPVLLARDTRRSGELVQGALVAGLVAEGVDVADLGVLPTPALAILLRLRRAPLGIVLSASHNPPEDNGIKVLGPDGEKIPDAWERAIERELRRPNALRRGKAGASLTGAALGIRAVDLDAHADYVALLRRQIRGRPLRGQRIVLDTAHGATCSVAAEVFAALGAAVLPIHDTPDGDRINRGCGATHPQTVRRAVRRRHAHAGVAFDGDGDRAILADAGGGIVDGDRMLAIAALDARRQRSPARPIVVATVMSNLALDRLLESQGIRVVRTPVGDRHVALAMRQHRAPIGGEQSGHIIFDRDGVLVGDGILTAARILAIAARHRRPLAELAGVLRPFPQHLENVPVREKLPLARMPEVARAIRDAERELGESGRIFFRYSGTERKARILVEGPSRRRIRDIAATIAARIARRNGAARPSPRSSRPRTGAGRREGGRRP